LVVCVEDDDGGLAIEEEAATLAAGRRRRSSLRARQRLASPSLSVAAVPQPSTNSQRQWQPTRDAFKKRRANLGVGSPAGHSRPNANNKRGRFFSKTFQTAFGRRRRLDPASVTTHKCYEYTKDHFQTDSLRRHHRAVQLLVVSHWAAVGISHSLHHATFNSTFSFYAYDFKNPRARSTFTEMFAANDRKPFQSCFLFYY
jgi:hypothetical protein